MMSMRTLGSISLLATGILVGLELDRPRTENTTSPQSTAAQSAVAQSPEAQTPAAQSPEALSPAAVPATNPALLPANDETNLRITPVVKAVQRAADSVVSIYLVDGRSREADGQGSGVILDKSGLVITNWHVVFPATQPGNTYRVQVRTRNQRQHMAKVVSVSPDDDLALLQLEVGADETLVPIVLGDSEALMTGETVIAIGNPRGHANTVTQGVLSAEDRSINVRAPDGRVRKFDGLLQTDAAINQGNSGGALLDITGKLIGINNAMAVSAENIGFAIPVNTMKRVFRDKLLSAENLATVWLGMQIAETQDEVRVASVDPLGPAARAGIEPGDLLKNVGGRDVANTLDYARGILRAAPGEEFDIRLQRRGSEVIANPVPLSRTAYELVKRIGVEVETVDRDEDEALVQFASRAFYNSSSRRVPILPGVVRITRVYPDSPAARLEAQPGDVLLGFTYRDYWGDYRDAPFVSEVDLADKIRVNAGRTMPIVVLRGDRVFDGRLGVR